MGAIGGAILKALTNPKIQKYVLYIALIILIIWVLSKSSEKVAIFVKGLKPASGEGIYNPVEESRKPQIEHLASEIKSYLDQSVLEYWAYGYVSNLYNYSGVFEEASALPNNELRYLADYYRKSYGISLYKDVDEETFYNNWDTKLLQRLKETNMV